MPHTIYEYPATDAANDKIAPDTLHKEVQAASLTSAALMGVTLEGPGASATAHIAFAAALSAPDKTTLDGIVAAHQGISSLTSSTPRELDGKPVVVTTPGTIGWLTWFHGAGDQASPLSRGGGQAIYLSWSSTQSGMKDVEWQYAEPVEMHDGQVQLEGEWSVRDTMDLCVRMPATTATPNGSSTGNANRVEIAPTLYLYIPAAGNGAFDIDLAAAVPVPSRPTPAGYWDCNYDTGTVTPAASPGLAKFNLYSFELKSYFMRKIPLGAGHKTIDVDVYRTDWIHQRWYMRAEITKTVAVPTLQTAYWAGWMLCFRRANTLA